jgi:hypothetical protein
VTAASKPWTYWISISHFAGSVLWLLTWGYLYLRNVVAARYAAYEMRSER